jgi:ribosome-associated heat shock protein Hsp15
MSDGGDRASMADSRRIDRWLWFARIVKSRTLAAGLVENGRVRLNREKIAKPSQSVKPGDVLTVTLGPSVRILKIVGMGARRGPSVEARTLYEDLTPPPPPKEQAPEKLSGERDQGSGRPTKRERRMTERLKPDY